MTDKDYIEYAKTVHADVYAMSTPMIDGIAGKVLTRIRKEQKNLFPLKEEWTNYVSNVIDVIDVMSVLALRGLTFNQMDDKLDAILERYIIERFEELEPKQHLIVKYRYVGEFGLVAEVKERIMEKLKEHHETQRMQSMLQRYPDLNDIQV